MITSIEAEYLAVAQDCANTIYVCKSRIVKVGHLVAFSGKKQLPTKSRTLLWESELVK